MRKGWSSSAIGVARVRLLRCAFSNQGPRADPPCRSDDTNCIEHTGRGAAHDIRNRRHDQRAFVHLGWPAARAAHDGPIHTRSAGDREGTRRDYSSAFRSSGTRIELVVRHPRHYGDRNGTPTTVVLTNAVIAAYTQSDTGRPTSGQPTEQVTFTYQRIRVTTGAAVTCYDFTTHTAS